MGDFDLFEFPADFVGRKTYVSVRGYSRSIPKPYTYKGFDGLNYVLPEYGGTWDGLSGGAPMIMRDIGEYVSVVDGTHISSRSAHREHMQRHDLVELGNERFKSPRPDFTFDRRETARSIYAHLDSVRRMPERQYRDVIERQQRG